MPTHVDRVVVRMCVSETRKPEKKCRDVVNTTRMRPSLVANTCIFTGCGQRGVQGVVWGGRGVRRGGGGRRRRGVEE